MAAILLNGDIDIAADASHSGTKNGGCRCTRAHALRWQITPRWGWMQLHLYQGLTPFAGRLRPVGAGCNCTCTRVYTLRWWMTPLWGWMQLHLYQGLRPSLADVAPLGLDATAPVPGFTPFADGLRPVGAGCRCTCTRVYTLRWQMTHLGAGCNCTCTRVYALRWQITPLWGWMQLHLYQGLRPSQADYAPLGLDATAPVPVFTPFAGRLRPFGAGCRYSCRLRPYRPVGNVLSKIECGSPREEVYCLGTSATLATRLLVETVGLRPGLGENQGF